MTPYPTTLSIESVHAVATYFRTLSNLPEAAHGAWDLMGFALGMGLPDQPIFTGAIPENPEAAGIFEGILATITRQEEFNNTAFPWPTIIALLLQILTTWFKR